MNDTRRLVVALANASSRAQESLALARHREVMLQLDAVRTRATAAILQDASKAAKQASGTAYRRSTSGTFGSGSADRN